MSGVAAFMPPEMSAVFEATILPMFRGDLSLGQSYGLRRLLDATLDFSIDQRAYILATVFHETARTMAPIAEFGHGAGKPYGPLYYGRGFCQLTWRYNYARFGPLVGDDLVANPDRAMDWEIALPVLTHGMRFGLFTGRGLPHYFGALSYGNTRCNPVDARAIVNGTDCAALIASYFWQFRTALERVAAVASPSVIITRAASA